MKKFLFIFVLLSAIFSLGLSQEKIPSRQNRLNQNAKATLSIHSEMSLEDIILTSRPLETAKSLSLNFIRHSEYKTVEQILNDVESCKLNTHQSLSSIIEVIRFCQDTPYLNQLSESCERGKENSNRYGETCIELIKILKKLVNVQSGLFSYELSHVSTQVLVDYLELKLKGQEHPLMSEELDTQVFDNLYSRRPLEIRANSILIYAAETLNRKREQQQFIQDFAKSLEQISHYDSLNMATLHAVEVALEISLNESDFESVELLLECLRINEIENYNYGLAFLRIKEGRIRDAEDLLAKNLYTSIGDERFLELEKSLKEIIEGERTIHSLQFQRSVMNFVNFISKLY